MRHLRSSLLILSATSLFFAGAHAAIAADPPPAPPPEKREAQAPADPARVKELFRKGMKAYEQGRLQEAHDSYRAAWDLLKSYDIAGNLALVELELKRYRDAAEHAAYAIANFPPVGTDKQRRSLEELLAEAKKHVGALYVRVSVDGAEVTVDGVRAGASPLATPVFVEPGDHEVVASSPSHEPAKQTVHADAGSAPVVSLTLKARGGPAVPTGTTAPTAAPGGGLPVSPVVIGGGVAALLAAGAGAAFTILSNAKASDAQSTFDALSKSGGGSACAGATQPKECATLLDLRKSRDTLGNLAVWSFIGAGALGAGTVIYMLVAPKPAKPQAGVRAVPIVSAGGGGAVLEGVF
jgi:hypothetical protein